jgi:hypothetical protein
MSSGWSSSPPAEEISSGQASKSKEIGSKTTSGKEIREYDDEVASAMMSAKKPSKRHRVPYQGKVVTFQHQFQ